MMMNERIRRNTIGECMKMCEMYEAAQNAYWLAKTV